MISTLLITLALVSSSFAANAYTQQPLPKDSDITTLTSGTASTYTFPVLGSVYDGYVLKFYAINVPEAASSVVITASRTDSVCGSLYYYFGSDESWGLPCAYGSYEANYTCRNSDYQPFTTSGRTDTYSVDESSDSYLLNEWVTNATWYIAVGRGSPSDYNNACAFTLTATVTTGAAGTISVPYDDNDVSMNNLPYVNAVAGTTYMFNGTDSSTTVFKLSVPINTAYVQVNVSQATGVSSSYAYIYGKAYSGSGYYSAACRAYGYGNFYYNCVNPRAGNYYVSVNPQDDMVNATITFAIVTCAAGKAGPNCTSTLTALPTASTAVSVPANTVAYYYWDVAASNNRQTYSIAVTGAGTGSTNYINVRKNGFPLTESGSSSGYSYGNYDTDLPDTVVITPYDLHGAPFRYYVGFECNGNAACAYNVAVTATSEGSGSNSASFVAPSFMLLATISYFLF